MAGLTIEAVSVIGQVDVTIGQRLHDDGHHIELASIHAMLSDLACCQMRIDGQRTSARRR